MSSTAAIIQPLKNEVWTIGNNVVDLLAHFSCGSITCVAPILSVVRRMDRDR